MALHALFTGVVYRLSCTLFGNDPCPNRSGRRMVPWFARDSSSPAPDSRSWFVSHAQNACIDAYGRGRDGHTIFEMALRFDSNQTRMLVNTFLTARARSAQWTAFSLDALSRGSAMTIPTIMLCTATISRCAPTAPVGYTQNLNYVSLVFSPRQHAHCTPRTLASTHVCLERVTTEVENTT